SMYDLRIGPFDAPEVAIECVGAINSAFTETWNKGPAREPLQLSVKGNWSVTIAVNAHVKTVKRYIEAILKELESRGLQEVHVNYLLRRSDMVLFDQLETLNIAHIFCYDQVGTGRVYFGMPGIGGAIDKQGSAISGWVGEFLLAPARQDVLYKLE